MNRLISFLKYTAMSFIAAGMVVGLVFLELQTDFVSDVRVFLGMKEGRVSANSLAFSSREGLIDRVVNWRAYSGQNRHLPAPLRGWDRNEASGSPEAVRQFVKSVRPAVAEAKVQPVSAPAGLSKDQVEQIERAGQLNMAAHGFQTGAATYGNGDTKFIVVIRKVPNRFGGVLNRMSSVSALLDAFEDGAEQTIIDGRVFTLRRPHGGQFVTLSAKIGSVYYVDIAGNASVEDISDHVAQIDFYRLEKAGAGADDPIDAFGPLGKAFLEAQGVDNLDF